MVSAVHCYLFCSGVLFALVKPTPKVAEKTDGDSSPAALLKLAETGNEETTLLKDKENESSSLKKRIL